jgi:hypothetical protein
MHPEILRELVSQHERDLRRQAHQATLARTAGRGRRAGRRHAADLAAEAAGPAIPAVPDYVDGTFRAARDEMADRVPAARRAA